MKGLDAFSDAFFTNTADIDLLGFVVNLVLASALAGLLSVIYRKLGRTSYDRSSFAGNFYLITTTTMVIITVIKSSLALSLGLVGALSIVRFRAAIKEPEELAYLFLAIAIGLGLGANQVLLTVVGFAFICGVLFLTKIFRKKEIAVGGYHLSVSLEKEDKENTLDRVIEVLNRNCSEVEMKRLEQTKGLLDSTFAVQLKRNGQLAGVQKELRSIDDALRVTFLSHHRILE